VTEKSQASPFVEDMAKEKVHLVHVPIVGIGASAGGLEAFETFFKACPSDTGMAFVLVPHLSPDHQSLLAEILQRNTVMPVVQALDQIQVEANHVYIIPPNRDMAILNGVLQLSLPHAPHGLRLPIDGFLSSLADDQANRAIGIILSGTASDGTLGLRAILGVGGLCMVQTPDTAKYDSMPQSAINAGYVTHILNVEEMPSMLQQLLHKSSYHKKVPPLLTDGTLSELNEILLLIRSSTGHDFTLYKKSTIGRRIERRMALHQIKDMSVYARFLKQNTSEVHTLFNELLINVTSFFRDPEAFVALKQDILPALFANKSDDYVFRAWVAGCSSGEEAYSIAIIIRELMDEANNDFTKDFPKDLKVQIYATDLDGDAISAARSGRYPAGIAQDVTPERLKRFFTKNDYGYNIKKDIREMLVFAVQSVIKDPPFTQLDLLSCRNLLIYLETEQQNRLLPNFHFALKPGGVLFLSSSESAEGDMQLFTPINRKWKFYSANRTMPKIPHIPFFRSTVMTLPEPSATLPITKASLDNVARLSNRFLLQTYAPPSVTTDSFGNILYVHGDTSRFLRQPAGVVTTNLLDMARDGLQIDLRVALQDAKQGASTLERHVSIKTEAGLLTLSFSLRLLPSVNPETKAEGRLLLVSFKEVPEVAKPTRHANEKNMRSKDEVVRIEQLERELAYSHEYLQAVIEEQQATNEELKSANEELETSKEEMQSLNEETLTINSDMNSKIELLSTAQNDLKNLMDNVSVGILFMDYHLNIRSYTRDVVRVYRLIATDVGRPLGDIVSNLKGEHLLDDLHTVLETLIPLEREVQTNEGVFFLARMQPYRTLDNIIDGVVLSFTEIDLLRKATISLASSQLALQLSEGIVNTIVEPLIVLNSDLQVISASSAFYQHFKVLPEQTVGKKIYDLGNGQWNIPNLRKLLDEILPQQTTIENFVVEHNFPELGPQRMMLNARGIKTVMGNTELILLAMVSVESKD